MKNPRRYLGSKYEATKNLDVAEIAKLIRADIKEAVKKGELPKAKYSVTIERYSGGQSIDVRIKEFPHKIYKPEDEGPHGYYGRDNRTDEARAAEEKVEAIRKSYNYDDSDSQVDYFSVRYYGSTSFDWKQTNAEWKEREAAKATVTA